jgi:ribonuclease HI
VATGAYWAEDQLADIQLSDGMCPHCGQAAAGPEHMLWNCAVVNGHRKCKDLCNIRPGDLPKAILNGLPPALTASLVLPPWGAGADSETEQRQVDLCTEHGMALPGDSASKNALVNYHACERGVDHCKVSARRCFSALKHCDDEVIMPVPWKCYVVAPSIPNVYTDGSWLFPLKQYLGLGGAGVWWPQRCSSRDDKPGCTTFNPLSDSELSISHFQQKEDGLQLFTSIGGFGGSSTRCELAAGILALCANGPVHVASDSEAFVDMANSIVCDLRSGVDPEDWRPFKLRSDGDLWAHFTKVVRAKGFDTVAFTWVKGHATDEHVRAGITTATHKHGNFVADQVADIGTQLHGKDTIEIAG